MKKILMLIIFTFLLCSCAEKNEEYSFSLTKDFEIVFDDELSIEMIEDGVFVVNHEFPWEANSLILEMKTGEIVLIDTPYENDATEKIIEWIRENINDDVKIIAINTGYHFDNLGGNEYLNSQGIEIYGTEKTVNMIDDSGEETRELFLSWLRGEKYKKYNKVYSELKYCYPTKIIKFSEENYNIEFGNEELILYYPGESHAPDNVVVYFPQRKVLFGSCMVKSADAKDLGNISDANIYEWEESINKIMKEFTEEDVDIIIPGHGNVGGYELLYNTKELIEKELSK